MNEKFSPNPEREPSRISLIVEDFRRRLSDFVPRNKVAAALAIVAALSSSCARIEHGQGQVSDSDQKIEDTRGPESYKQPQDSLSPENGQMKIAEIRKQIAKTKDPTSFTEHQEQPKVNFDQSTVLEACGEVIQKEHQVQAINVLREKNILAAFVEIPIEGGAETEEATDYQALLFTIGNNGELSLITKFSADTFDTPKHEFENNPAITNAGISLKDLTWLVQNSPTGKNLVSIK